MGAGWPGALLALALSVGAASFAACGSDGANDPSDRSDDDDDDVQEPRDGSTSGKRDARADDERTDAATKSDAAAKDASVRDAARDSAANADKDAGARSDAAANDGSDASNGDGADAASDAASDPESDAATASCPSGALFCEDFEALDKGDLASTSRYDGNKSSGSTLTVDDAHARGKRSLHVHTQSNGHAELRVKNFAPPNNSFFGRMHAYVEALPTAPNYAHYTLVEAEGMGAGLIRPIGGQYIAEEGANLLGPGSDQGPTGDWVNWNPSPPSAAGKAPFTAGKWVCFEFQLDASDNTIRVWIDGEEKSDLTVSTKKHPGGQGDFVFPKFEKIWFGWWLYQGGSTPDQFDLWLDDLALATKRLGC